MERKFYDIRYHLFDLSHPNLLAFLLLDDLISRNSVKKLFVKLGTVKVGLEDMILKKKGVSTCTPEDY